MARDRHRLRATNANLAGRQVAEEALTELRQAEEQWMLAVNEAEARAGRCWFSLGVRG